MAERFFLSLLSTRHARPRTQVPRVRPGGASCAAAAAARRIRRTARPTPPPPRTRSSRALHQPGAHHELLPEEKLRRATGVSHAMQHALLTRGSQNERRQPSRRSTPSSTRSSDSTRRNTQGQAVNFETEEQLLENCSAEKVCARSTRPQWARMRQRSSTLACTHPRGDRTPEHASAGDAMACSTQHFSM